MVVAVAVGREGINTLLVASQVVLSVVLPFIAFPLIYLTSSEVVMRVRKHSPPLVEDDTESSHHSIPESSIHDSDLPDENTESVEFARDASIMIQEVKTEDITVNKTEVSSILPPETIDYSNGWLLMSISYIVWFVVLIANGYAIVMLAMGKATN